MAPLRTAFDRVDLDALYPPFARKAERLVDACVRRGAVFVATSGLRTWDEQARIYAIGRTRDRDGRAIGPGDAAYGRHVTDAEPGTSDHNFGLALDFVRDADGKLSTGLQPAADRDANYLPLAEEARALGLESGFYWQAKPGRSFRDLGHVQLPLRRRGITLAGLATAYRAGAYPAVFALLDRFGPW